MTTAYHTIPDSSGDESCDELLRSAVRYVPGYLQFLNTAKWLLTFFCIAVASSTMAGAIFPTITDSLERRFKLRSTESGLVVTTYDIAAAFVVLAVCYWGERGHKGRWIGGGCLLLGLGSALVALPHFLLPPLPQIPTNATSLRLCSAHPPSHWESEGLVAGGGRIWFYFFLLAQTLRGIGATPLGTLAIAFIDENVSRTDSPMFISVKAAIGVLGMAVGTFISALLLNLNADFERLPEKGLLKPGSNGFIGCWWMGFFITGAMSVLIAFPLLAYPPRLPRRHPKLEDEKSELGAEVHQGSDAETSRSSGSLMLDDWSLLPSIVKSLVKNPVFLFFTLRSVVETFFGAGFGIFFPKLLNHVFQYDESTAALLCGGVVVLPVVVGTLVGGWMIQRWEMRVRAVLVFGFVTSTLGALASLGILFYCPSPPVAGLDVPYPLLNPAVPQGPACNGHCVCADTQSAMMCDEKGGLTFTSPCVAGCTTFSTDTGIYGNCSCAEGRSLRPGVCKTPDCPGKRQYFIAFWVLICLFYGMSGMPLIQSLLRSVPHQHRTFALGLLLIPIRLFGTIIGPLFMGWVFDQSCTVWQRDGEGKALNCIMYDNDSVISWCIGTGLVIKVMSGAFLVLPILLYRPPGDEASTSSIDVAIAHLRRFLLPASCR